MAFIRLFTYTSMGSPSPSGGTMEVFGLPNSGMTSLTVDGDVLTLKGSGPPSRIVFHVDDLKLTFIDDVLVQQGTITSVTYNVFGQKLAQVTGLDLSAVDYFTLIFEGDIEAAYNLILGGADKIFGTKLDDYMAGLGGADTLYGYADDDAIGGQGGRDLAYGGAGKDAIEGGDGNDKLFGGSGADTLDGGLSRDQLTGGSGADQFVFSSTPFQTAHADIIMDFVSDTDKIVLYASVFTAIGGAGTLAASAFRIGNEATSATQRIIYEKSSGKIYYDADGNGGGGAFQFAQIDAGMVLKASDFQIIS